MEKNYQVVKDIHRIRNSHEIPLRMRNQLDAVSRYIRELENALIEAGVIEDTKLDLGGS